MALLRDAAIIHHGEDGRETVHLLNAPFRGWRPSRRQRVYQFESENGTLSTRTVGGVRWDAEVTVRFDALPTSLLNILALGVVDGLTYVPSLSAGGPGYEMQVLYDGERIGLDPDSARWAFGEYEVTFRIRRPVGETLEGLIESGPWLYLYTAGAPGLTTARQTPATYHDRAGLIRTAGPGVLRLDWHDQRPYALVEGASENLVPWSEDLSQWNTSTAATITPDGDLWRLSPAGPVSNEVVAVSAAMDGLANGSAYVIVAEVARGNWDVVGVTPNGVTTLTRQHAAVDLSDGSVVVQGADVGWVRTERLPDGLWRIMVYYPSLDGGAAARHPSVRLSSATGQTLTGDGSEYVLIRRVWCEPGPLVTSFIPTTDAPATRDRDLVSTDYAHPPGSMAVYEAGIAGQGPSGNARAWQIGAGTSIDARSLQVIFGNTLTVVRVGSGSTNTTASAPLIPLGAEYQRLAILDVQGTQARVRLLQRYRETPGAGPWIDASGSWSSWLDVSELLAQGWESKYLTIGNVREGTRAGRLALSLLGVLRGADWSLDSATRLPQVRQVLGRGR